MKPKKPTPGHTVNALSGLLGTDRRTLGRALAHVRPRRRDGKALYELAVVRRALARHFARTADSPQVAELKLKRLETVIALLDVKLGVLRGELVPVANVEAMLTEFGATMMAMLRQKLENEFPITCAGLEPAQVRVRSKALVDGIVGQMDKAFAPWRTAQ